MSQFPLNGATVTPADDLQMAISPYAGIFMAIGQMLGPYLRGRSVTVTIDTIKLLTPGMPPEALGMPQIQIGIHEPEGLS